MLTESLTDTLANCSHLTWWPDLGMGCQDAPTVPYDGDYWAKYIAMDDTKTGERLTAYRFETVFTFYTGPRDEVVDVGIGGGRFVRESDCMGFDINPKAVEWLKQRRRFRDYHDGAPVLTFWDSLEHIRDPAAALRCASEWAFVSLPIFESGDTITESRHYRPGEHFWYWTHEGFIAFVQRCGFRVVYYGDMETRIGRESIKTYALQRVQ